MAENERDIPEEIVAALTNCENEVDHLKRENTLLREASRTFGALAERLNETLESERRRGADRRAIARATADRRRSSPGAESAARQAADTPRHGLPIPRIVEPRR